MNVCTVTQATTAAMLAGAGVMPKIIVCGCGF